MRPGIQKWIRVAMLALVAVFLFIGSVAAAPPQQGGEPPDGNECECPDWYAIAVQTIGIDEDALWTALNEGKSLAEIAQEKGVEPQTVIDAIVAAEKAFVEESVTKGEISRAEADEWLAELDAAVAEFVQQSWDEGDWVDWYAVAARTIGIDEDALWTALDEGKSLAEIAQEKGVEPQVVIDAIVAAEKAFVEAMATKDEISRAEADEWLAELDASVAEFVQHSWDEGDCVDWYAIAAQTIGIDEDAMWTALNEGKSLTEIAQEKGVEPQVVIDAIVAAEKALVEESVTKGEISRAEADEWLAELDASVAEFVQQSWDEGDWVNWYAIAAQTIGIDEDALWTALDEGKSLAEIAQEKGVEPQTVIDAIVAAEKAFVEEIVTKGEVSRAEADEWLAELDASVAEFVQENWMIQQVEPQVP